MRNLFVGVAAFLGVVGAVSMADAQTLRMMKSLDAPHYDGQRTTWSPTSDIVNMFQDTLVAMDWDGKTPIPYLAKSWTVSPDGKLYTFKLRDDVQFCSGKKFTADDVVYSFKRLTSPELKAPLAWRAGNLKDIRATDKYTVEYELAEPFSDLLLNLTMFTTAIHNKESVEALGKDYGTKAADGTGPWCFESWQPRTEIVLKRHDAYKWGPSMYQNKGPVKFEKLSIKIVPEDASRVAAMMGGQFDVTHQIPLQFIPQVKASPNLNVQEATPNFQLMYYGYKTTRPMVADKRVREAMNIAINRAEIVKGIMLGQADPAYTFIDPKALDFAELDQEHHQGGRRAGQEASRRGRLEGRRRRHPREGRGQARAQGLFHPGRLFRPRVGGDPGLHAQDRHRLEGPGLRLDHRLRQDERAGLRFVDGHLPLHVGRRPAELLLRFQEHPRSQPDELERSADRRAPAQGQGFDERRRSRQVLRLGPAARHRGASLDAGDERGHVHHQLQEAERRAAAHALSEHLLQGPGLLVLMDKLLEVRGLRTYFHTDRGLFRAVDGIDFSVDRGKTVGLVGESGCGKSVTSLSVMGLVASPPGQVEADAIKFDGRDVLGLSADERRRLRGGKMSMIFQEPMTSLNPVHTIGQQIVEAILAHTQMSPQAAKKRAIEMLELVRIPSAAERIDDFPHRLSGGMRQRVMIAMALSCEPSLLIADEPTTALDVTIQAQILDLLADLQKRLGMAVLIITHDLGVIAEVADDVLVMYAGKIVESAPVDALFADPQHPYTIGLLGSIPRLDVDRERLSTIEGTVPSPNNQPKGCRFSPRCPFADRQCREEPPPLRDISAGHQVACWKAPVELVRNAA